MLPSILNKLLQQKPLGRNELSIVFQKMLNGELEDNTVAEILTHWRDQGESADLLIVGAKFLRANAVKVDLPKNLRPLFDNCGTGGSGKMKFNVSTASAIVASACGVPIAKHGNRAVSGKAGSADLLFAAGYPEGLSARKTAELLEKTGFTFFFAPNFHPLMKHVGPVRKALGFRTVFNLLGPLANPIAPEHQLLGVSEKKYLEPMATALNELGTKRSLVVHSQDGLDEISPAAPTDALIIEHGKISNILIEPKTYKISAKLIEIQGGTPQDNVKILNEVLEGKQLKIADAIGLNAGTVLWLSGKAQTLEDGLEISRKAIKDGSAKKHFESWLKAAKA